MIEDGMSAPVTDSLCHYALADKRSLFIDNVSTHPVYHTHRMPIEQGIRVYASVPIWVGDQLYGTLVFLDRKAHAQLFSEEDKAFIELLAAWFGKAHGAGPNVNATLKMFFPEGLGVTVPEKLQPDVLAVKLPVLAIAIDTTTPRRH